MIVVVIVIRGGGGGRARFEGMIDVVQECVVRRMLQKEARDGNMVRRQQDSYCLRTFCDVCPCARGRRGITFNKIAIRLKEKRGGEYYDLDLLSEL